MRFSTPRRTAAPAPPSPRTPSRSPSPTAPTSSSCPKAQTRSPGRQVSPSAQTLPRATIAMRRPASPLTPARTPLKLSMWNPLGHRKGRADDSRCGRQQRQVPCSAGCGCSVTTVDSYMYAAAHLACKLFSWSAVAVTCSVCVVCEAPRPTRRVGRANGLVGFSINETTGSVAGIFSVHLDTSV